jgi:hypothetical protein
MVREGGGGGGKITQKSIVDLNLNHKYVFSSLSRIQNFIHKSGFGCCGKQQAYKTIK